MTFPLFAAALEAESDDGGAAFPDVCDDGTSLPDVCGGDTGLTRVRGGCEVPEEEVWDCTDDGAGRD